MWLIAASFFFYAWVNPIYLLILIGSILFNYYFSQLIQRNQDRRRKTLLVTGIVVNLLLLGYFKYADFFISNLNAGLGTEFNLLHIILPIGISFFTFQQIAFLVDTYKGLVQEYNFVNYSLFVSFFPQLLSGPISHHKELMTQFADRDTTVFNDSNFAKGLFRFNMGLAKKVIIADAFGKIADVGYMGVTEMTTAESWITCLAYTMQLYFDFSGYSDMAIGIGTMFNVVMPENFNSPNSANSIQDFYRRWHMTLSRFMRDYIYIPLGGNRKGELRTSWNLFITFVIGGLWHGASWTFVFWGGLNGIALVAQRQWSKLKINIPNAVAIAMTFMFVLLVRVFFRADNNFPVAINMFRGLLGMNTPTESFKLIEMFYDAPMWIAGFILLFVPNTTKISADFVPNRRFLLITITLIVLNLTILNSVAKRTFLYFDF
jgi:D-alanyl-lipoteichoic acid acyltransferase DltB (MBOAT superfamily)